jgi:hypothetical protein
MGSKKSGPDVLLESRRGRLTVLENQCATKIFQEEVAFDLNFEE